MTVSHKIQSKSIRGLRFGSKEDFGVIVSHGICLLIFQSRVLDGFGI